MEILGVEMITAEEIGKLLHKSKSDVSRFIAKANLTAVPIQKTRYYSKEQFINYLKYGKIENRIMELLNKVITLEKKRQN